MPDYTPNVVHPTLTCESTRRSDGWKRFTYIDPENYGELVSRGAVLRSPYLLRIRITKCDMRLRGLTFNFKQSSPIGAPRLLAEPGCGHASPNCVACCTPENGLVIFVGDLKRRFPTGGWANGIPRKRSVPLKTDPRNVPMSRVTSGAPLCA